MVNISTQSKFTCCVGNKPPETYKPRLRSGQMVRRYLDWLEENWLQAPGGPMSQPPRRSRKFYQWPDATSSLVQTTFIQLDSRKSPHPILRFTSTLTATSPQMLHRNSQTLSLHCISEEQLWKWWPASGLWVYSWLTTSPGASTLPGEKRQWVPLLPQEAWRTRAESSVMRIC